MRHRLVAGLSALAVALTSTAFGSDLQAAAGPQVSSPAALSTLAGPGVDTTNPFVLENRKPGTRAWIIPASGKAIAEDSAWQIKGFASANSVDTGEPIDLKVSVKSPGDFTYQVFRMGWYQGQGGRQIDEGTAAGITQPACTTSSATGMLTCPWDTSVSLDTTDWLTGIYFVVLTKGSYQNWVQFVVRDDAQQDAIVAMLPVNTFQAYNNFPEGSGKSLYDFNSSGAGVTDATHPRATKVSFDRPYAWSGVSHKVWDAVYTAGYLEGRGFSVKYTTNDDLHREPGIASGHKALLSLGHDEYWSGAMYTAAEQTRDSGVDLGFFGGNDVFWQIRYEPSATGVANRVVVCYKLPQFDPEPNTTEKTILFRQTGRPEQPLLGAMYDDPHGELTTDHSWVVQNSGHWIYRGTSLANGSTIPRLVGGEVDKFISGYPAPTGSERFLLSRSPFTDTHGHSNVQESWIYRAPSGARVFDAGTWRINPALGGIGDNSDDRVRTMGTNLLARYTDFALTTTTARDAGVDRYETAVLTSRRAFPATTGGTVAIATGLDFPDALAATPVTRSAGPLLLVRTDSVPPIVADELKRLAPTKVVVAGGSDVVSDGVVAEIEALVPGVSVERAEGPDRYSTAAALSASAFEPGVPVAYVATGLDFPDALAAGAAGAHFGGPVLLTKGASLNAAAAAELARLQPKRIVVVGGTSVVSTTAEQQLRSLAPEVVRLAGMDRYETSRAVARDMRGSREAEMVALATGTNFPDALSAGPAVAALGGSLVLVGMTLAPGMAEEVVRNEPALIVAVGGTSVVPTSVLDRARSLFDTANGLVAPQSSPSNSVTTKSVPTPAEAPLGLDEGREHDVRVLPSTRLRDGG